MKEITGKKCTNSIEQNVQTVHVYRCTYDRCSILT